MDNAMQVPGPGCVLKFGFGRKVQPQNLKVDPYKKHFFKKKWPIYIGLPIDPILDHAFHKGSFIYQEADFATHVNVGSTSPYRVFCTEYPPPAGFVG